MSLRGYLARRRLRCAARLLARGVLQPSEYAAIAVDCLAAMRGVPPRDLGMIRAEAFRDDLAVALGIDPRTNIYLSLNREYGPADKAIFYLGAAFPVSYDGDLWHVTEHVFTWAGGADRLLAHARLRLRRVNRGYFAIDSWLGEQQALAPHAFAHALRLLFWVVSVIGAYLLGRSLR